MTMENMPFTPTTTPQPNYEFEELKELISVEI